MRKDARQIWTERRDYVKEGYNVDGCVISNFGQQLYKLKSIVRVKPQPATARVTSATRLWLDGAVVHYPGWPAKFPDCLNTFPTWDKRPLVQTQHSRSYFERFSGMKQQKHTLSSKSFGPFLTWVLTQRNRLIFVINYNRCRYLQLTYRFRVYVQSKSIKYVHRMLLVCQCQIAAQNWDDCIKNNSLVTEEGLVRQRKHCSQCGWLARAN